MSHTEDGKKQSPWVFIVNLHAGSVRRRWKSLEKAIPEHFDAYEIHFTEGPKHATSLAEQLVRNGYDKFVGVGGDGTNQEIVTGILRAGAKPGTVTLGIVPVGTGGDFARMLLHRRNAVDALVAIPKSKPCPVDVGWLSYQAYSGEREESYFLNCASFGLSGLVDQYANNSSKALGGKASFVIATLRALMRFKGTRVRLVIDGEDAGEHDIANAFIANGVYLGGGMIVGREARMDSGSFVVSTVPSLSAWWLMRNIKIMYDGSYREHPLGRSWIASHIEAYHLNEEMGLLDVDGENLGKLDLEVRALPGAICVPNLRPELLNNCKSS